MLKKIVVSLFVVFYALSYSVLSANCNHKILPENHESESINLHEHELCHYLKEGYVIKKGLFSNEELDSIKFAANDLKAIAFQMTENINLKSEKKIINNGTQFVLGKNKKGNAVIKRIVWVGKMKPELLEYGRSPKILGPVSQILEHGSANHLINQLHFKIPGDEVTFTWHTDKQNRLLLDKYWRDVNGKGSYVVAISAIDKITMENGPLYVIPGSHLITDLVFDRFCETDCLPSELNAETSCIPLLMNPGDTVFIHPDLVHGSWENNSDRERKVFINGFSYPGANHAEYPGEGSGELIRLKKLR